MSTHTVSHGSLEQSEHERWPVSKWTKFISVSLFTEAVILFLLSFLLFFIKRTTGNDPHMVSGAFDGTTQLTYFISVNLVAALLAIQGYYLYFFNNEEELRDDHLRKYFKTAGIAVIPVFVIVISVFLRLIL